MSNEDAHDLIIRILSSGPKTPESLREACLREGIVESTYYYHLRQMIAKLGEVEEISEHDNKGRIIIKYALKREEKKLGEFHWIASTGGICAFKVGGQEVPYPPSRTLLELAAWIKHNPEGWNNEDINVKNAKLCLEHTSYFIPAVEETSEDPDSYAFVWPEEYLKEKKLSGTTFSRFFNYKNVYNSFKDSMNSGYPDSGPVFLGAFCSTVSDEPISVIVALRKEGLNFQVVYMECRLGKLDKTWVKAVSSHLKAKSESILSQEKLKETDKRKLLLSLRDTIDNHLLILPNRYKKLFEDLLEFSYNGPLSGYVLALALAVQKASKN